MAEPNDDIDVGGDGLGVLRASYGVNDHAGKTWRQPLVVPLRVVIENENLNCHGRSCRALRGIAKPL